MLRGSPRIKSQVWRRPLPATHLFRHFTLVTVRLGFISEAAADHPQIAAEVDELRAENAGLRQAVDRLTTKNDELQAELDENEVELVEISRCFDVIAAARRAQAE